MGEESLIKNLIAMVKCGVCGQKYQPEHASILGHNEDLWYLKALCHGCHTQALVAVVIKEDTIREVITDLSREELGKFRNSGLLTGDDVLDMHGFLKEFEGNVTKLLNQE